MYPSSEKPVKEEDFDHQITDKYFGSGWTKVYNEKMCEFYSRISPTKYTVIRHSNIYGPHDKFDLERSHVFGATITKVLTAKNGKLTVWGDGSEKRDFLYVDDLIGFVELIIKKQKDNFEIINIGSGSGVSVTTLANEIMAASGKALKLVYDLTKPTIGFDLVLNTDKAKTKYGWKQKIELKEGIRRTLQWCSSNIPT